MFVAEQARAGQGTTRGLTYTSPMLATLADMPPIGDEWSHEIKHDGYRTQLILEPGTLRAFTRSGLDWSDVYRHVLEDARKLGCATAVLDGEMVVQDENGRSDFHALRRAIRSEPERIVFYAFDLLHLDGADLRKRPLRERREQLQELIGEHDPHFRVQFSDAVVGGGPAFFEAAERLGVEGVVSKKLSSRYASGRSRAWLKIKSMTEGEFVVIGTSRGERAPIALLACETDEGLVYAGPAWVTLAEPDREAFWAANETLKTRQPAVLMEPRKETSWLRPEMKVRVRHLKGEALLRHATVQAITALPSPRAPARPKSHSAREPTYEKPHIDNGEILAYYERIAPVMLPWVKGRPLNLFRCAQGRCFFQRNCNHPETDEPFDEPIHRLPILQKNGRTENYLWVSGIEGILACAKAGTFEFHGWGSRVEEVEKPDRIAFDLDPGESTTFDDVKAAAQQVRRSLDAIGLASWPLLSGGKGIHVVVPLIPDAEWLEVRNFAKSFCTSLASAAPDQFTVSLPKSQRVGRIFLDFLRNQRTATAVLPFSARARDSRGVAAPVDWKELRDITSAAQFQIGDTDVLERRSRTTSLRAWGRAEQRLPIMTKWG